MHSHYLKILQTKAVDWSQIMDFDVVNSYHDPHVCMHNHNEERNLWILPCPFSFQKCHEWNLVFVNTEHRL